MSLSKSARKRIVARLASHDVGDVDSCELLCMGDLHMGDPQCDMDMIREAVVWLNAHPDRRAVIAGDLLNAALRESVSDVYSEAMSVRDSRQMLVQLLKPAADRIIAVVGGNHDRRVNRAIGDDIVEVVCATLGIRYYGPEAFLVLKVGNPNHLVKRSPINYSIYLAHGYGGGRMVGGKANSLKRLAEVVQADCYIAGHTHAPLVIPDVVWSCDTTRGNVVERQRMFVSTGASLDRLGGYAAAFGFPALAKCWPIVTFGGREKRMSAQLG